MIDVNKLVKGDRIIVHEEDEDHKYLVTDVNDFPKWIYVREIYENGSQDNFQYAWYVDKIDTQKIEKVYDWCNWRKYTCPDGGIAKYKTNRRDIIFKRDGIEVSASCHDDDIFDLTYGLGLCWDRWNNNQNIPIDSTSSVKVTPKKINMNNLKGEEFGDYVAISIAGKDKSRHNIWQCVCPKCGDVIYATAYDLTHGRKNTVCSKCKNKREKELESSQVSSKDYETIGYIHVGDYPCNDNSIPTAISTTSTTWYDDGTVLTTYNDFNANSSSIMATSTKNSVDSKNNYMYDGDFFNEGDFIYYREIEKDLLSYPVYYKIAHCIPADLTFHGETAKRINNLFNLSYIFKSNGYEEVCEAGEVILEENVFTLLPNKKKFSPVNDEDLIYCLNELAFLCAKEKIKYLAMPRICCGGNKKDWNTVRKMIIDAFIEAYDNASEPEEIYIDFCYQ